MAKTQRASLLFSLLPISLTLLRLPTQATKTCYFPDGTTVDDSSIMPSIATDGLDCMCCRINFTYTGGPVDTCERRGLCLAGGTYWRDYYTDPTWESENCLRKDLCTERDVCASPFLRPLRLSERPNEGRRELETGRER